MNKKQKYVKIDRNVKVLKLNIQELYSQTIELNHLIISAIFTLIKVCPFVTPR